MLQIPKTYLYSISRKDIPLAQQAIQAGHSAVEYAYQFGRPADHHPSYVHLSIRDKSQLEKLKHALETEGIKTAEFHEPYQDWGLTSISCLLTEEQRKHLSHLQL